MDFLKEAEGLGLNVQADISLAPFTTWKVGGRANFFLAAKGPQQVIDAIKLANQYQIEFVVIGGGSNILVSDSGFNGLVIKIELEGVKIEGEKVTAAPGVAMSGVAGITLQNNLAGLEWAIGIPGTVGGAVFGNSNCFGGRTADTIESVVLADRKGESRAVGREYFNFSYDYSKIQETGEIVLEVTFKLKKVNQQQAREIREHISKVAAERYATQPLGEKCAGSTFKALVPTPEVVQKLAKKGIEWKRGLRDGFVSAGFIIDKCLGLKGYQMGQVKISEKHANFFISTGAARALDVKKLIDFVKKECKNKLDIELEEEIKYVGQF